MGSPESGGYNDRTSLHSGGLYTIRPPGFVPLRLWFPCITIVDGGQHMMRTEICCVWVKGTVLQTVVYRKCPAVPVRSRQSKMEWGAKRNEQIEENLRSILSHLHSEFAFHASTVDDSSVEIMPSLTTTHVSNISQYVHTPMARIVVLVPPLLTAHDCWRILLYSTVQLL